LGKRQNEINQANRRQPEAKPPRRWWWFGHHDPVARYTAWLSIYTGALVVATVINAVILWITDHTLKETLVASNRAWIAPNLVHLPQPLKVGEDAMLLFYYGNIGKEPATNVGNHSEAQSLPMSLIDGPPEIAAFKLRDAINDLKMPDSCSLAEAERFAGVVYPGSLDSTTKAVKVEAKWLTQPIVDGFGFVIVKGCIVYETMRKSRRSEYCFLYNSKLAAMRPEAHRQWLQRCVTGNSAT
jgi:hypothetical protein